MFPEKRTEILYVRVKKANKEFVKVVAEEHNVSESVVLDYFLDEIKRGTFKIKVNKEHAGKKKSSVGSLKKV